MSTLTSMQTSKANSERKAKITPNSSTGFSASKKPNSSTLAKNSLVQKYTTGTATSYGTSGSGYKPLNNARANATVNTSVDLKGNSLSSNKKSTFLRKHYGEASSNSKTISNQSTTEVKVITFRTPEHGLKLK